MSDGLYPVFDIPTDYLEDEENEDSYRPSPMFDFERGDFVRDESNRVIMCDGREAYKQWCVKAVKTQRGACDAYTEFGIMEEEASSEPLLGGKQTAFERTITEALMLHPNTESVNDFAFEWEGDELFITFTVEGKDRVFFDINMNVIG